MELNHPAAALLGLTVIVGAMAGVLAFAILRFISAARASVRKGRQEGAETEFMAGALEDALTNLRMQERAMKERAEASERLSSEIIASMTSGLLVVDQDRRVRILNPAGRHLLGRGDDAQERAMSDVLSAASPLASLIEECLANGKAIVRRTISLPTSGGAPHLGVTVSPVRDLAGRPHGALCLFTDLSEIVELEEQLRLKDSLARLGELTAGIAHEFRNGLATIHGYGRLLDLERLPPDFKPFVAGIRQETEALGEIVTNFLNFARPAELTLGIVDMAAIAERAADDIRNDVRARSGTIDVRGEFAEVEGDDVLLRQALSNLCRNALEACGETGVAPRIAVEGVSDRKQGTLRITVSDNGPGIDPAVAPRMFRPFFTTTARGTGLGLALVQKIVVTHNGRVAVDPNEGGARITITLPLASR
jgi:PAS domain S-box-containing protein